LVKSKLHNIPSMFKVTLIESNEKYAAMCASDFAILHNGQVTVEAAACQLPATVIDSMPDYRAYFTYLFNGLESPLNISTNYMGYEDLCGWLTVTGTRVCSVMLDHFNRPKLRYYYIKLYRD
jgi:hypothetical protein